MSETQKLILEAERRARAALLTIDELCERAGIRRSTWQRWKAGDHMPRISKLRDALAILDAEEAKRALRHTGSAG